MARRPALAVSVPAREAFPSVDVTVVVAGAVVGEGSVEPPLLPPEPEEPEEPLLPLSGVVDVCVGVGTPPPMVIVRERASLPLM
ncbi:hypothetical protein DSECCO2_537230 [anaerobic digester metagenome]